MRTITGTTLALLLTLVTVPAFAGNLIVSNGNSQWQSTGCTEPVAPASLLSADKESAANDLNQKMQGYNSYAASAQAYMDCVSKEAEGDANVANQTISQSAQRTIEVMEKKVVALHDTLKSK